MPREDSAVAVDKHKIKLVDSRNRSLGHQTGRLVVIAKILQVRLGRGIVYVPIKGQTVEHGTIGEP